MENKCSEFGRFVINIQTYKEILDILNKVKNLTAGNVLTKLENLERHKYTHIVEWELKDFTLIAKHDVIYRGTLLHVTAALGHKKIMTALLERGADIEAKCSKDFTPLHYSVKHDQVELAEFLISQRANIHAVDRRLCTPLHLAAAKCSPGMVKVLLLAGAGVNARDEYGYTPLHFAVNGCQKQNILETVNILVHFGADVNATDQRGDTVLHKTILKADNSVVLDGLLTECEDVGDEFLKIVTLNKDEGIVKVIKFLLDHGAIAEARNHSGNTVLHCAIMFSSFKVVKLLIRYGANVNARDYALQPPLLLLQKRQLYCDRREISEIVNILIKNGSDFNAADNSGIPTLLAIQRNDPLALAKIIIRWVIGEYPEINKPFYLYGYPCLSEHWDFISTKVNGELRKMNAERGRGKAFFEFLFTENSNKLASYTKNPNVQLIIQSGLYRRHFPMHARKILKRYLKGMKRLELLNKATQSIIKLYHFSINSLKVLPEEVARNIAFYLKNKEIRLLNSASEFIAHNKC